MLRASTTALAFAAIAGCTPTQTPTLTPLEIQALQTREFETDKTTAFGSVITVFQDLGYVIQSADKDTGFITAASPTTDTTTTWHKMAEMSKNSKTSATAFVEERAENRTSVRLNFVVSETESHKEGRRSTTDSPILDAELYQQVFNRIDQAIFVRTGMK